MIEYAVLIVMVIFAVGFAWLWFIEQKKKRKRREALQQKRSGGSAQSTLLAIGKSGVASKVDIGVSKRVQVSL